MNKPDNNPAMKPESKTGGVLFGHPLSVKQRYGNEVPVDWKQKLEFSAQVSFTFWQRVKIFFGFNVGLHAVIFTQHVVGKYAPQIVPVVTPMTDKKELVAVARMLTKVKIMKAPEVPESVRVSETSPQPTAPQTAKRNFIKTPWWFVSICYTLAFFYLVNSMWVIGTLWVLATFVNLMAWLRANQIRVFTKR